MLRPIEIAGYPDQTVVWKQSNTYYSFEPAVYTYMQKYKFEPAVCCVLGNTYTLQAICFLERFKVTFQDPTA